MCMPKIFHKDSTGVAPITPLQFATEGELEATIVETPNLLAEDNEGRLAFVSRQVHLGNAGILDVLLVDAGAPVAVEVKLGRNAESRREVVGQVVDYVSVLTSMTVDELDQAVGGALEQALRSLVPETDSSDDEFERMWLAVGTNLRAGFARYVIAIDEPPADLLRIVRFLAARSNLRVSLVSIRRYVAAHGETILVPEFAAHVPSEDVISRPSARATIPIELQSVLEAYESIAEPGFHTAGQAVRYRKIQPPAWPAGAHYEFLKRREGIGVELHLESKPARLAEHVAKRFAGPPVEQFPYELGWEPNWTYGPRLFATFDGSTDTEMVAKAMKQFIRLTHPEITAALSGSTSA